ncbi:hypothetical protein F0562_018679 [Nyssa sinensis]|uniref:Rad21/Rec8-like protein N-terminal domain-containing protein n=1 Tax=Nyssa sinensis TaxID=561372 RepID=A0A5J4ZBB3_9ASTE|nr:hypothetical protein F0562_018679 [Nyssa sinensis]
MFYSHTFLARKGPLGTVWCAAHLHHKLKKSHYTSTDISSTVDHIMYPEVPIALRMSGHLLLGVVRIYSKKVDYLYQDCNVVLIGIRKAFASVEVNLPEDATHAPFHSVTLPDTFELDALDLDNDLYYMGSQDNHLRSQDEITLADQIPSGRDPYIAITFDVDILRNSLHVEDASGSRERTMDEGAHPSVPVDTTVDFQDPGPSNPTGIDERLNEDSFLQNIPEIEVLRDAVHDFNSENIPAWPDQGNDVIEPDSTLEQQMMKEKICTPVAEVTEQHREPPSSAASEQAPLIFDSHISFGHGSPELVIRSSPPAEQPKPRPRPRKRKQPFDENTVLTNKFMKKALKDSSDLSRKRKNCPCSSLEFWKSNNRLKKEKIFIEPLMNGLCAELCNIYKKDYISAKPHLVFVEEARPEPSAAQSPAPRNDLDLEIERLRDYEGPSASNILPELGFSLDGFMPSPSRRDDFTPASVNYFGSHSEPQEGTTIGTGVLPTPDLAASTGPLGSDMETPMTFTEELLGIQNTVLSDIPEDLIFLTEEDDTPTRFQGTPDVNQLSVRTRAVAQYIKRKSSVTPISEDFSGDLILNKILEGKSRKVCARMFFETLVLKGCGLVDLQQEEPYSDISLKVTPKLMKDQSLN